jgi:tellurite resistance protein
MKPTDKPSESAVQLTDLIKKAIRDCEVTTTEYDQIQALAAADGVIDAEERGLLNQLQQLIENQTVKKVAG